MRQPKIRRLFTAISSVGALLATSPASATLPRAEPPSYSAYGPFELCSDRFVINIAEDEALHIVGDIARVISDRELLAIKFGNVPEYQPAAPQDSTYSLTSPNWPKLRSAGFSVRKFEGATPDAGRTVPYAPHGLQPNDIKYALAPGREFADGLIVGATSFDNSAADQRLLSRIKPPSAKRPGCLPFSALFNRDLDDKDAKRAYDLSNFGAALYPAKPDQGPAFRCLHGIGFALQSGESLLRPWRPLGDAGALHVLTGGSRVKIGSRFYNGERLSPGDPANFNEHPMSMLRKTEVTYYPSRGVGPPYAEAGVREPGSWEVKLIESHNYGISFSFPASQHTAAGFSFLERLQFVKDDDPRCGSQP